MWQVGLIPNQLNNKTMNPYIIQSSLYLSTIYEAIIAKQEILRVKMQQYNDVKLYLFSFILPEYSSNEYIKNSLKLYNENELFPIIITSITYKEVNNPRIAFKNENGIIHLVLCFEHDKEDWQNIGGPYPLSAQKGLSSAWWKWWGRYHWWNRQRSGRG